MRYLFGLLMALAVLAFAACGGDGGECAEPAADAAGEWEMTATPIQDTCGGSLAPYTFPVTIMQEGNALTGQTPEGTMTGTICGDQVQMSGSSPEAGGTATVNLALTVSADGNSVEGSDTWTWAGGTQSCGGSESLSGTRMTAKEFPCTEQGIRDAIAEGGGPHTFGCDGPTTVSPEADIVIDNDVLLDGEGNLRVHGGGLSATVFSVPEAVNAELRRLVVTGGGDVGVANEGRLTIQDCVISGNWNDDWDSDDSGGGVFNAGEMTVINSTISENKAGHGVGGGISNAGKLMLVDSTVSDNAADGDGPGLYGGGIFNNGEMSIVNSTVSGNTAYDAVFGGGLGGGIANAGWMSLINCTVSGNSADSGDAIGIHLRFHPDQYTEIANTLIDGDCAGTGDASELTWVSRGYNIESPGNTCGFDQTGDQSGITEAQLNLGPLADNGGPTMTHALLPGSVAIDHIPAIDCEVTEDQRGLPRPGGSMCDVGAFEVQP